MPIKISEMQGSPKLHSPPKGGYSPPTENLSSSPSPIIVINNSNGNNGGMSTSGNIKILGVSKTDK